MCINDIAISLHIEEANYVFDPNWTSKNGLCWTTGPIQTTCRSQYALSQNKQEMETCDNFDFSSNVYYISIDVLGLFWVKEMPIDIFHTGRKETSIRINNDELITDSLFGMASSANLVKQTL